MCKVNAVHSKLYSTVQVKLILNETAINSNKLTNDTFSFLLINLKSDSKLINVYKLLITANKV